MFILLVMSCHELANLEWRKVNIIYGILLYKAYIIIAGVASCAMAEFEVMVLVRGASTALPRPCPACTLHNQKRQTKKKTIHVALSHKTNVIHILYMCTHKILIHTTNTF